MYKLFYWDREANKEREVFASESYDLIWDAWVNDKENQIIYCPLQEGENNIGEYPRYLVKKGRKPAIYASFDRAVAQTDGVSAKPHGYGKHNRPYIAAWLSAVAEIERREERDTEIVRKSCGCCWYCGSTLVRNYSEGLGKGQRDHQTSRVNGGGDEIGNMVLACEKCNTAEKNYLNLEDYRAKVLAANPQAYLEGKVIFFGEQTCAERHRLKREENPQWVCPGERNSDIPCTQPHS